MKTSVQTGNFSAGFSTQTERGRFRRLARSEFQTDGVMKLKEPGPKDLKLRVGIFKTFSLENMGEYVISDKSAERRSKVRQECAVEVSVGKSCRLSCTAQQNLTGSQCSSFNNGTCYVVSLRFVRASQPNDTNTMITIQVITVYWLYVARYNTE